MAPRGRRGHREVLRVLVVVYITQVDHLEDIPRRRCAGGDGGGGELTAQVGRGGHRIVIPWQARVGAVGGATVYDFEDDDVDGELLSPQGANVSSRARSKHASLITVRPHFINEMVKMANDI